MLSWSLISSRLPQPGPSAFESTPESTVIVSDCAITGRSMPPVSRRPRSGTIITTRHLAVNVANRQGSIKHRVSRDGPAAEGRAEAPARQEPCRRELTPLCAMEPTDSRQGIVDMLEWRCARALRGGGIRAEPRGRMRVDARGRMRVDEGAPDDDGGVRWGTMAWPRRACAT